MLVARPGASVAMSPAVEGDHLATEEEQVLMMQLRARFARELAAITAPCLVGDVALLRVLRGNGNDLEHATAWMKRCLLKVQESELEKMLAEMSRALDEAQTMRPLDTMLPHYDVLKEYVRAIFTAPKLTPSGDLVNYISLAHFDMWALMKCVTWQHWVKYMHGATAMRMVEVDRQSRLQGRLVRVVTIIDVADCKLGMFTCPQFHRNHSRDLGSFQESVAAEIFGQVVLLNAPWLVQKLCGTLMHLIPERFRHKFRVVDGDGTDNPDFVRAVGGLDQLRQLLAVRESMFHAEPGLDLSVAKPEVHMVRRRQVHVESLDVLPGQRLEWTAAVLPGSGDLLMGASDLLFSIDAIWTGEVGDSAPRLAQLAAKGTAAFRAAVLRRPERLVCSSGEVSGSLAMPRPGVVFLRWSNAHGPVRRKALRVSVALTWPSPTSQAPGDALSAASPRRPPPPRSPGWCACWPARH